MIKNVLKTQQDLVPVFVSKEVLEKLLKEYIASTKKKVVKAKLFVKTTEKQIMGKLHKTREQLLKKNPHAYINYNS